MHLSESIVERCLELERCISVEFNILHTRCQEGLVTCLDYEAVVVTPTGKEYRDSALCPSVPSLGEWAVADVSEDDLLTSADISAEYWPSPTQLTSLHLRLLAE